MKHTYWGIGFLACCAAAIGCIVYILVAADTWPADFPPLILMFLFLLLADMCGRRVVDKEERK